MNAIAPGAPVSTLELFLDLVFVFTITQLSNLVVHPDGAATYLHAALVLLMVWWMYSGYIWLTSNVGSHRTSYRLLMFGGMGGFLVMALSIPSAFGAGGLPFALGYLLVTLIHAGLFRRANNSSAQAIGGIFSYNLTAALLLLAAGLTPGNFRPWLWLGAVAVLLLSGVKRRESGFRLRPDHFAERHGLILLIALGESIVAIGVGIGSAAITPALVLGALLGLALSAALWWSYFDRLAEAGAARLAAAPAAEQPRLALQGFGFSHVLMIAGIVLLAAGVKLVTGRLAAADPLTAWSLAAGVSLYLLGDVLFQRVMTLGNARRYALFAGLALLSAPLGLSAGGPLQLAALLGLLTLLLLLEGRAAHA
ncbi:low temperature requirement protein A [Deinococcus sp.]|uniref:low temperature requirement protein A n=1 Tax=Deinococcus sp. TaxID=47478 RepID=UPI0025F24BBA|nr:low temperature requirement protein A [Deinococcus sp.]